MLPRRSRVLPFMLVLAVFFAYLFPAGCGSASIGEYTREVSELSLSATEVREEISHLLSEEENHTEGERTEGALVALAEASDALQELVAGAERIKVPAGMEDFHRALVGSYQSEAAFYRALSAALEGGGHAETSSQADEDHAAPPGEESPAEGGGH